MFLTPKNYRYTINEIGFVQDHKSFKRFNKSKRLFARSQYFNKLDRKKISAISPRSRKKSFFNGVVIPVKMRRCNECQHGILCTTCIYQLNENKKYEANLNLSKREAPFEFGHMLPYFKKRLTYLN